MERLALLFVIAVFVACTPNAAPFTVVNHSQKDAKIYVDEQPHTVRAGGFVNLAKFKGGTHYVKVDNTPVQTITLEARRTTVMDIVGDGCYVVANYTPQYTQESGGTITIDERFKKQPLFTTRDTMTVPYGDPLPRKVDVGVTVRRLHAVDCSIVEVDRAIIEAVARLP